MGRNQNTVLLKNSFRDIKNSSSMKLRLVLVFVFTHIVIYSMSQNTNKQNNTTGSELFADAPYRINKNDNSGNLASLPIYFYIHDSEYLGFNNEIAYLNIKLKSASDTVFGQTIVFNNITQAAFLGLFKHKSNDDIAWGNQSVDNALPRTSSSHSIIFTADTNWGFTNTPIVDITRKYFYFTFNIPPAYLTGLDDIIDIEITYGLDYEPDQYVYLRVFRSNYSVPSLTDWYRGDTHYHTFFTQNLAENGLPLDASKYYGSVVGLNWLITTDHSSDFDNYGTSKADNWNKLGNDVSSLNSEDSAMILIRGIELAVNNSAGKLVHALIYPNANEPFSLPYIADGNGDTQSTTVNLNNMFDSVAKYNATCYAPHPFAENDKLSIAVNGGVWNLADSIFPSNGESQPSLGTVISNDTSINSDIFNESDTALFSAGFAGLQLWNTLNGLSCTSNGSNPWNVEYTSGSNSFTEVTAITPTSCDYRFNQNLDVYKAIIRKGLIFKNQHPLVNNWKFFMEAGSDAHGSFNYSNTDLTGNITGSVTDNAIGRLSTLVYCPQGMGLNGKNILEALKNGHSILSSGPILTTILTNNAGNNYISGDDAQVGLAELSNYFVKFNSITTPEFGTVSEILLFGGTENGEVSISFPVFSGMNQFSLSSLILQLFPNGLMHDKYFYIRAQLTTIRLYNNLSTIYKKNSEVFNCYTNPIWIKINSSVSIENYNNSELLVYPNPATNYLSVDLAENFKNTDITIYNSIGTIVMNSKATTQYPQLDISRLTNGMYIIEIKANNLLKRVKFIKV
jgi:hypothetical protein